MGIVDIDYPAEWSGYSIGGRYGITTTGIRLCLRPENGSFTITPINSRGDASRAVLIDIPFTYDILSKLEAAVYDLREALDNYNREEKEKDEKQYHG